MTHATRITVTKAGVRIGSAYVPPPPQPSRDGEVIQSLLLPEREQRRLLDIEPPELSWKQFTLLCLAIGAAGLLFAAVPA